MLAPYFGPNTDPVNGELRETERFYDLGIKLSYDFKINTNTLQVFAGMKNILNSYQKDFDISENRDPAYIYGPNSPRTIYFGVRFGNFL
jgi:outer membrane receptor for ferrienterochelin and colicins